MRHLALVLSVALLALPFGGCTVLEMHDVDDGVAWDGLVSGYATAGWVDTSSLVEARLLDGRGSGLPLAMVDVWQIVRAEIGLPGFAVGLGPLNFGIGVLTYSPRSPRYVSWSELWDFDDDEVEEDVGEPVP